jgi:hypothetical protein
MIKKIIKYFQHIKKQRNFGENFFFLLIESFSFCRVYTPADSTCQIPVNIPFNGDLTIHITHATINQSRRTHVNISFFLKQNFQIEFQEGGNRICELTINSNFITTNHPELSYPRNELDGIDQNEKSPTLFRLSIEVTNSEKPVLNKQDSFTRQLDETLKQSFVLFQNENDFKQKINDYGKIYF